MRLAAASLPANSEEAGQLPDLMRLAHAPKKPIYQKLKRGLECPSAIPDPFDDAAAFLFVRPDLELMNNAMARF